MPRRFCCEPAMRVPAQSGWSWGPRGARIPGPMLGGHKARLARARHLVSFSDFL